MRQRRADRAHAHGAQHAGGDLGGFLRRQPHIGQDGSAGLEQGGAGGRERDAARQAVKERRVQFLFQRLDLLRQRRLRNVQALGGAAETALFGHRHEIPHLLQIHGPVLRFDVGSRFSYGKDINSIFVHMALRWLRFSPSQQEPAIGGTTGDRK